jgi:hypothetical protein
MRDMRDDHERRRRMLWIDVAIAVAGSGNSTNSHSPGCWANDVLREYDRRFPESIEETVKIVSN